MTDLQTEDYFAFSPALELKFADLGDAGTFSGHAAVFGNTDSHGDVIRPGAFAASLAQHKAAGTSPVLLWAHDQGKPIGRISRLAEDSAGLSVTGRFNLSTTAGREAHAHAKAGDANGLSIGYIVPPGGATHGRDGKRTIQRMDVHEISMVALPSNSSARIREVKSLASAADLEKLLREGGLSRRAAEKIASAGFAALTGTTTETKSIDLERVAALLRSQALELKGL
jgi:HK97 family phage prohead protease